MLPIASHLVTTLALNVRPDRVRSPRAATEIAAAFRDQARGNRILEWADSFGTRSFSWRPLQSACLFSTSISQASWHGVDWGFPNRGVFTGFGMGALRCSDGLSYWANGPAYRECRAYLFSRRHALPRRLSGGAVEYRQAASRASRGGNRLTPSLFRAGRIGLRRLRRRDFDDQDAEFQGDYRKLRARIWSNLARS